MKNDMLSRYERRLANQVKQIENEIRELENTVKRLEGKQVIGMSQLSREVMIQLLKAKIERKKSWLKRRESSIKSIIEWVYTLRIKARSSIA